MANDFEITGLDELIRDLEELPRTVAKTLIVRALREGAKPIEEQIKANAPDDPKTSSSRVRDNITTNVTEQTATGAIAYIGPTKKGFMAGFAEFGTKHQPARPFMGPAFDQKVEEAVGIMAEVLGDGIEKALKK